MSQVQHELVNQSHQQFNSLQVIKIREPEIGNWSGVEYLWYVLKRQASKMNEINSINFNSANFQTTWRRDTVTCLGNIHTLIFVSNIYSNCNCDETNPIQRADCVSVCCADPLSKQYSKQQVPHDDNFIKVMSRPDIFQDHHRVSSVFYVPTLQEQHSIRFSVVFGWRDISLDDASLHLHPLLLNQQPWASFRNAKGHN